MGFFRSLEGTVRLELTSADVNGALRRINEMGVAVSDVQTVSDLTVCFCVSRRSLKLVEQMAERKGERVRLLQRKGLFWTLLALRCRPVLIGGMLLLMLLSLYLPSRVLFVEVEGNATVPEQLILEAAKTAGIRFGASRRAVRSEKMKNALLGAVPELQWAGVNTYGCTAIISVRERAKESAGHEEEQVTSIVATRDGVITSCTITSGNALCSVGQAVQKGQVLVSGYTDCGQTVVATRAQGEIFAQTSHELTVIAPAEAGVRGSALSKKTNFSLQLGKNRINFKKGSGISDATCVKMYTQYHLTLPGGYGLPVTLIQETVLSYELQTLLCSEEEAAARLSAYAKDYLRQQMVALTIQDAREEFFSDGITCRLTGHYGCTEMIGREQREQIGDFHGKTD